MTRRRLARRANIDVPVANRAFNIAKLVLAVMIQDRTNRDDERFRDRDRRVFQRNGDWHPPAFTPGYKTSVLRSPQRALISLDNTLGEITGPVFGHNIIGELDDDLIHNFAASGESAIGERIIVHGRVVDERGRGVAGALLEVWQANAGGRYRHKKETYLAPLDPNFGGCGRTITDADGFYRFRTVKSGPYPWPNGAQRLAAGAYPCLHFRSRLRPAAHHADVFPGRPADLEVPDRENIPDRAAVERLIAPLDMMNTVPMDARAYKFDIVLRGRRSTLFENRLEGN